MAGEKWDQEHGVSQKPFQETQRTISYTPKGKRTQVYTIEGTHIYNRDGKEVYIKDSVDRNKIFANLAVKSDRCRCIHFEWIYTREVDTSLLYSICIVSWDKNFNFAEKRMSYDTISYKCR